MSRLQQGSVVWADLPAPAGRRPVVVLTRGSAIGRLNSLTVAPITRTLRNIPSEVVLTPADGVPTICAITLENILTIPHVLFDRKIAALDQLKMAAVFAAIRYVFDMP